MKYKSQVFYFIILVYSIFMLIEYSFVNYPFRYLKYCLPFLGLLSYTLFPIQNSGINNSIYISILKLLIIVSILLPLLGLFVFDFYFVTRFLNEAYFILAPILFIIFTARYSSKASFNIGINLIFISCILSLIIEQNIKGNNILNVIVLVFRSPSILATSLLSSDLGAESTFAFCFGLFSIYFFYKKKNMYLIISLFLTLLSFKRITIIALFLAFFVIFTYPIINKYNFKNLFILFILLINLSIPFFLISLSLHEFDDEIYNYTNLDANAFTMGRQDFYRVVYNKLDFPKLYGIGLGHTSHLIRTAYNGQFENIHSDLVKNIYEFGILGFIAWVIYMYKLCFSSPLLLSMMIFLNVNYISDNIFIYFHVQFIFYFMILDYLLSTNKLFNRTTGHFNKRGVKTRP